MKNKSLYYHMVIMGIEGKMEFLFILSIETLHCCMVVNMKTRV